MSTLLEEYRSRLPIDTSKLEEELIDQPVIFDSVADQYAIAISERDAAEAEMKRVYAAVYIDVKRSFEKISDARTDVETLVRVEYIDAQKKFYEAKLAANQWAGLKESFSDRASMLKSLVELLKTGFFAANSIPNRTVNDNNYMDAKTAGMRKRLEKLQENSND